MSSWFGRALQGALLGGTSAAAAVIVMPMAMPALIGTGSIAYMLGTTLGVSASTAAIGGGAVAGAVTYSLSDEEDAAVNATMAGAGTGFVLMVDQQVAEKTYAKNASPGVLKITPSGAGSPPPALDQELLDKIRHVESGGDPNVPPGDKGKALGPFQIWSEYYKDAVEHNPNLKTDAQGRPREYMDVAKDTAYAEKVVESYMERYATEKRLGRPVTKEDIARIHNGGPNGYKKSQTDAYWQKVKNAKPKP